MKSVLGIIVFAAIFYLLHLIGFLSVDGILSQYIWQTFAYFIDVGTIAGEDYGQNTTADKIFKIIITIFGIIIFSSFIGIISQALANRIEELRAGEGIVVEKNHIIIFNFTRKTIPLLSELFKAYDKEKKTIIILSDKKPKDVLAKIESAINIPKNITDELLAIAKNKITLPMVSVTGVMQVTTVAPNGVELIKDSMSQVISNKTGNKINISYLGSPKYKITAYAENYKTAEKKLTTALEKIQKSIGKNGTFSFSKEKN